MNSAIQCSQYFDMPGVVSRLMYLVLFVAPALQSAATVLLALLGVAMLGLSACSCSKKNSAVASKILSKSQHLLERNTGEQLLGRTQYRARVGRRWDSREPETGDLLRKDRKRLCRIWSRSPGNRIYSKSSAGKSTVIWKSRFKTSEDTEYWVVLYLNYSNNM
jgi:hypothetical protein